MKARLLRPGAGRLVSSGFPGRPAPSPLFVVVCRRCAASFSSSARSSAPENDDQDDNNAASAPPPTVSSPSISTLPRRTERPPKLPPSPFGFHKPPPFPPPNGFPETPSSYKGPLPLPPPPPALPLLFGKTALITGGSRGIGWAIAARLAAEGVSCTLIGRDEAALERAVLALPRPLPPQTGPFKVPLVGGMANGYVPGVATAAAAAARGERPPAADDADPEAPGPATPIQHYYRVGDVRDENLWKELFAWEETTDTLAEEAAAAAEEQAAAAAEAEAAAAANRAVAAAAAADAAAAAAEESKKVRSMPTAQLAEEAANELERGGGAKLGALLRRWAEEDEQRGALVPEGADDAVVQAQALQAAAQEAAQEAARARERAKARARQLLARQLMARKSISDVDFLVNAAGVTHTRPLARISADEIRQVLDTNLLGSTLSCAYAMHAWVRRRQRNRCIINIASLLATHGGAGAAVYAASKAGIIGLTRGVAAEGAGSKRRIRANVILPGYIQTDMLDFLTDERLEALKKKIPRGRLGSAYEVADAALFLAKNDYANNCVLNLDGGLSAVL